MTYLSPPVLPVPALHSVSCVHTLWSDLYRRPAQTPPHRCTDVGRSGSGGCRRHGGCRTAPRTAPTLQHGAREEEGVTKQSWPSEAGRVNVVAQLHQTHLCDQRQLRASQPFSRKRQTASRRGRQSARARGQCGRSTGKGVNKGEGDRMLPGMRRCYGSSRSMIWGQAARV